MSKRCLVLGGSGTLGRAVCEALHATGARVCLTYREGVSAARDLAGRLEGALALELELAHAGEVARAVERAAAHLGGLDALVQCAGVATTMERTGDGSHHLMANVDEAGYDRMMDVNVKGSYFACKAAIPHLRAAGGGNIVLTGSADAVKPVPSPVHYATSKGALLGMAQAMAKELGPHGVKVNLVCPGLMEGGLSRDIPANLLTEYVKHCGLKRVARPDEIAPLVAWLATENTLITGQVLLADGAL